MGPPLPTSRPSTTRFLHGSGHTLTSSEEEGNSTEGSTIHNQGDVLRRGHSDGDVLRALPRGSGGDLRNHEETWMDFLRDQSRFGTDSRFPHQERPNRSEGRRQVDRRQERQMALERATTVVADRKRRLTETQEEHVRRRSVSSLPFGPSTSMRRRELPTTSRDSSLGHSDDFRAEPPMTDRSLPPPPRRPSCGRLQTRQSREITLPSWQPDSEVSNCPICGTSFGFWYRKHHCRKCGRVVCASCSPHRITIPRQFIVQPPQETNQRPSTGLTTGIEVVDLTDDANNTTRLSQEDNPVRDTPRSPNYSIDPALGGGQEVRLCNPCVPDPNPLPHLPLSPPDHYAFESFPRPEIDHSRTSDTASSQDPASGYSRRASFSSRSYHPRLGLSFDASREQFSRPPRTPSSGDVGNFSRPSPPNYSSIYGSAPNASTSEVSNPHSTFPSTKCF